MVKKNEAGKILEKLKILADPKTVEGMARFGISLKDTYGVAVPHLRKMAKEIGRDHELAQSVWATGVHEAKILASMIDDPDMVTEQQMDSWVADFDSWDVCDQVCMNLFDKTKFVFQKVRQWSECEEEFIKRAGFALIACFAFHDKKAGDEEFIKYFSIIEKDVKDERNFVKKAVNWALRQIGKRNLVLNKLAISQAKKIQKIDSKSAKWIAMDAIRELESEAVLGRLKLRSNQ